MVKVVLQFRIRSLFDSPDRDDFEVELPICTLGINPDLCDRALRLAARADLRVLGRAADRGVVGAFASEGRVARTVRGHRQDDSLHGTGAGHVERRLVGMRPVEGRVRRLRHERPGPALHAARNLSESAVEPRQLDGSIWVARELAHRLELFEFSL